MTDERYATLTPRDRELAMDALGRIWSVRYGPRQHGMRKGDIRRRRLKGEDHPLYRAVIEKAVDAALASGRPADWSGASQPSDKRRTP